jgi:lipoprotein signal peptidase
MNAPMRRSYLGLFFTLAVLSLVADQASKYGVHAFLVGKEHRDPIHPYTWSLPLIPGAFDLQVHYEPAGDALVPHVNRGAVNGWLNGWAYGNEFFAVVSFLAACAIVYWIFRPSVKGDRVLCTALGLILGGTLGNLYDRIVFDGVRDFLHWHLWFIWPDFNIADSCLVCGASLLLLHALFVTETPADEGPRAESLPAPGPVGNSLRVPGQ